MDDIEQIIKYYIKQEFMLDKQEMPLDNKFPLIQEGIIDSLGIFTLIAFLDERFGTKIQPEDVILENFETIDAIHNLISAKRSLQALS